MPDTLTPLGKSIISVLSGQPFHLMYEERNKNSTVEDLNPLLLRQLNGDKRAYPTLPGTQCDLVFLHQNEMTWMETKLLQTHNGGNRDDWRFEGRNGNFKKHLGIKEAEHASAVRDVRDRLPTLDQNRSAHRIAFLAVVYDSPRHRFDQFLPAFTVEGNLFSWTQSILIEQPDPRPRAQAEAARISVYLWERRVVQTVL